MAQGRGRAARSPRTGGRGGGGGIPWLGLGLLLVIGVAVVVARSMGLTRGEGARSAEVTLTAVGRAATRTPQPAAQSKPTAGAPAAAAPTAVQVRPTPAPTRSPQATANAITAAPQNRATPAPASSTAAAGLPTGAVSHASPVATTTSTASVAAAGSVALTFDAGADRGYAEDILDLLLAEHVVASFGITGDWARANPELVRRMVADGHMVFNHTLDHRSFTGVSDKRGGLSATRRRAELEDADAIIAPLIGHSTQPWYRLPYGDDDAQVAADVHTAGYSRKVGWTVDSLGWRGLQAPDIVARCLNLAAPGAVYVLHVGRPSQDAIALPQLVNGLREKGYSFHRIDQV